LCISVFHYHALYFITSESTIDDPEGIESFLPLLMASDHHQIRPVGELS